MAEQPKQPVIVLLTSHWIGMLGVALVTLAGFAWLFVLPADIHGQISNPYIGLLAFIAIPIVFFAGLILNRIAAPATICWRWRRNPPQS
jgi:hypothetical protein